MSSSMYDVYMSQYAAATGAPMSGHSQQPNPFTFQMSTPGSMDAFMDYPMMNIETPGINDVMCGRGGATNNHIGNIRFRQLVNEHKLRYLAAPKADKPKVALELVQIWRSLVPPGRFLARSDPDQGDDSLWHDIGDKKARQKCSQSLRERTPDVIPFVQQLQQKQKEEEEKKKMEHQQQVMQSGTGAVAVASPTSASTIPSNTDIVVTVSKVESPPSSERQFQPPEPPIPQLKPSISQQLAPREFHIEPNPINYDKMVRSEITVSHVGSTSNHSHNSNNASMPQMPTKGLHAQQQSPRSDRQQRQQQLQQQHLQQSMQQSQQRRMSQQKPVEFTIIPIPDAPISCAMIDTSSNPMGSQSPAKKLDPRKSIAPMDKPQTQSQPLPNVAEVTPLSSDAYLEELDNFLESAPEDSTFCQSTGGDAYSVADQSAIMGDAYSTNSWLNGIQSVNSGMLMSLGESIQEDEPLESPPNVTFYTPPAPLVAGPPNTLTGFQGGMVGQTFPQGPSTLMMNSAAGAAVASAAMRPHMPSRVQNASRSQKMRFMGVNHGVSNFSMLSDLTDRSSFKQQRSARSNKMNEASRLQSNFSMGSELTGDMSAAMRALASDQPSVRQQRSLRSALLSESNKLSNLSMMSELTDLSEGMKDMDLQAHPRHGG